MTWFPYWEFYERRNMTVLQGDCRKIDSQCVRGRNHRVKSVGNSTSAAAVTCSQTSSVQFRPWRRTSVHTSIMSYSTVDTTVCSQPWSGLEASFKHFHGFILHPHVMTSSGCLLPTVNSFIRIHMYPASPFTYISQPHCLWPCSRQHLSDGTLE